MQLSTHKLNDLLKSRGLNLSQLTKACGISRQSVYSMLRGGAVFNVPFSRILDFLKVSPLKITEEERVEDKILKSAPLKLQKVILKLIEFCKDHKAALLLFGSRVGGKARPGSDWDFGFYFYEKIPEASFRNLKWRLTEEAFPYGVDLVNLNQAPSWFLESIRNECVVLSGEMPKILEEVA